MSGHGKWAPKLTFEERCGFLAAYLAGASSQTIVQASGLNRGTVTRLISKKYDWVYPKEKAALRKLGKDEFFSTYFTQDIQDRIAVAAAALQLAQAQAAYTEAGV